jgi:hypothetical protein
VGLKRFFRKIDKASNKFTDKLGNAVTGGKFEKFRKSVSKSARKNKIIRAVVIAAAIYFTAGAALGAAGSMAANGGFWSGVGSGLGSAASGVTSGTFLGGAYGSSTAAQAAAASAAEAAAINAGGGSAIAAGENVGTALEATSGVTKLGAAPSAAVTPVSTPPTTPTTPNQGLMGQSLDFMKSQGGGLLASTGLKLAGGAMADKATAEAEEEELARRNRNQNVSGLKFGPVATVARPGTQRLGPVDVPTFDPYQQTAPGLMRNRIAIGG